MNSPLMDNGPLRVLVVDDSATVRQVLVAILGREGDIEVTTAPDPVFALAKMQRQRPDVIITDLEMPRMDGLTFLKRVMSIDPIPTIVCSALSGVAAQAAIIALEEGAVGVVTKPRLGVREFLEESAVLLVDAVRSAALAHGSHRKRRRFASAALNVASFPPPTPGQPRYSGQASQRVVAIGASTGGTEAIGEILDAMPRDCPGIVIAQHMPEGFTRAFAERLNQSCRIEVKEAQDGDYILDGRALVAAGNRHLRVVRSSGRYCVEVTGGPLVSRHRPSVDVLFHSVAKAVAENAVGALLTGMGDDGALGLLAMREAGAWTLAQDEASCVVFGMPGEAMRRGAVDEVVSLSDMPQQLLRRARTTTFRSLCATAH